MVRTECGGLVSKFLSESFVALMAHVCDTDKLTPTETAQCYITEDEYEAVPEELVLDLIDDALPAFDEVGGCNFLRKKLAQLIKIAKGKTEVQLDLVSELVLYLIGCNCSAISWIEEDGYRHFADETFPFQERDRLIASLMIDDDDADDIEMAFDSFWSLMNEDRFVFWDEDFLFLLEDDVPEGTYKLFLVCSYTREWHERPWTDIGEAVPPVVENELNAVVSLSYYYGSLYEMRKTLMMNALSQ